MGRPTLTNEVPERGPRRFRVLATSACFEPGFRGGGTIRSVAGIVDTVSDLTDLTLITKDRDLGSSEPYPGLSGRWVRRGRSRVFYLNTRRVSHWLRLAREIRAVPFDLLYVNSLWEPMFTIVPILAAKVRLIPTKRLLIAPRGELSPGALSLKALKKFCFLKLWAPLLRSMNVAWHASAEREASEIRAVIPWAHIVVNHDPRPLPEDPIPATALNQGPPRYVFISRISRKKNLALTLRTLTGLSTPVQFDIYGTLEDTRYWAECEALIRRMPGHVRVAYHGELLPDAVRVTFSRYDAFLFPTLGENFGHVIAESLSASCPVLCSDQTPWTSVLEAGGGFVVRELTSEALGRELERLAALSPEERCRARQAAGSAYSSWREATVDRNVLEDVRIGEWPASS
jgi:glycosyltransferase involved in cell wall biosynthesis